MLVLRLLLLGILVKAGALDAILIFRRDLARARARYRADAPRTQPVPPGSQARADDEAR